jgi:all-trans-8'-apo-beta-carotenal 15,15'-oxygenase
MKRYDHVSRHEGSTTVTTTIIMMVTLTIRFYMNPVCHSYNIQGSYPIPNEIRNVLFQNHMMMMSRCHHSHQRRIHHYHHRISSSSIALFSHTSSSSTTTTTTTTTGTSSSKPANEDAGSTSSSSSISSRRTSKEGSDLDLPDMMAYSKGYQTVFHEIPFHVCHPPSYGIIPNDMKGTYYRVGPAMFSAGSMMPPPTSIVQPKELPTPDGRNQERMVQHPFDGDGAILGITFAPKYHPPTNPMEKKDEEEDDQSNRNDWDDETSRNSMKKVGNDDNPKEKEYDMEVSLRYRFIRTVGFTKEQKKGSRIYRGMDLTRSIYNPIGNDIPIPFYKHHLLQGINKLRKNTSNTRAIYWGKRLFTLWEGGQPYKIDDRSCYTDGKSRLGGALQKEEDLLGQKMCYDPLLHHAIFYGIQHQHPIQSTTITTYEFDSTFTLIQSNGRQQYNIPGYAMMHDMIITKHYMIMIQPDVTISNPMEFFMTKDPGKVLSINPNGGGIIHLFPRSSATKQTYQTIRIPPNHQYTEANIQLIHAYEDDDDNDNDTIIIDCIKSQYPITSSTSATTLLWPWGRTLQEYQSLTTKKALFRYTIHIKTNQLIDQLLLYDTHCYFGTINPQYHIQKYSYLYMNIGRCGTHNVPFQGICQFNVKNGTVKQWIPESYEFCGEPMYAPKVTSPTSSDQHPITTAAKEVDDEDSGYIISILWNGRDEYNEILIFSASDIAKGPITRIPIGGPSSQNPLDRKTADATTTTTVPNITPNKYIIPHGHFGCYVPNVSWSADEIERRVKLSNKIESRGSLWNEVKSDFSGLGLRLDDIEEYFGDFFN